MAPFGSAFKNGLLFTILAIPGAYLSATLFAQGLMFLFYNFNQNGFTRVDQTGILILMGSIISAALLIGVPFFKFMSDTVEEGMIEF